MFWFSIKFIGADLLRKRQSKQPIFMHNKATRCNKAIQPFDFDSDAGAVHLHSFSLCDEVYNLISFYSIAIKSVYGQNEMAK